MTNKTGPTDAQVEAQIARLQEIRPLVPATSWFGDDNQGAIDAQIEVLREDLSETQIDRRWDDDTYIHGSAMHAREWLDNVNCLDGAPSEGWEGLVEEEGDP